MAQATPGRAVYARMLLRVRETWEAMDASSQPAATWPRRIGRIVLILVSVFALGAAGLLLLFALLVLFPAWDGGIEAIFVGHIVMVGVPLLGAQLVFGIVLLVLRKRLASLRAAFVLVALAVVANLGALGGVVALLVHNDRLIVEAHAADAAALADLEEAVQAGDVGRAGTLLENLRVAALLPGEPAARMLSAVVDRHDRAMLEMFLEKCPSLPHSASPDQAAGPLHRAAAVGDIEIARLLIAKGFQVNRGDETYRTPLAVATEHGRTEMAEFLASQGAVMEDRASKALDAAADRDGATVRRLVEEGVDPNTFRGWGRTLLHYAAGEGDRETAELLLGRGADVNARDAAGETPLHAAARRNRAEMIRLLASKGADADATSRGGYTALDCARASGHQESILAIEQLVMGRKPTTE